MNNKCPKQIFGYKKAPNALIVSNYKCFVSPLNWIRRNIVNA